MNSIPAKSLFWLLPALLKALMIISTCSAKIHGRPSVSGTTTSYTGCTIKNKAFDRYLYAAGDHFKYNKASRRVFLWSPSGAASAAVQGSTWNLKSLDGGESWSIENKHWTSEYLYTDLNTKALKTEGDGKRRQVYTYRLRRKPRRGVWRLESVDGGSYVSILNVKTRRGEYLFADGESEWDEERRRVFAWARNRPRGQMWEESKWRIDCQQ